MFNSTGNFGFQGGTNHTNIMPYEYHKHSSLLSAISQQDVCGPKHFTRPGSDLIGREDEREISPLPEQHEMSSQREENPQNFMVLQACPQTETTTSADVSANAAEMANTLDRYIEDLREANKQAEESLLNRQTATSTIEVKQNKQQPLDKAPK